MHWKEALYKYQISLNIICWKPSVCNAWMESWVRKIAQDKRMIPRAVWWELIYVCLTQQENETQHQPPARLTPGSCVPCFVLWEPHMRHNSEPAALYTAECRHTDCSKQTLDSLAADNCIVQTGKDHLSCLSLTFWPSESWILIPILTGVLTKELSLKMSLSQIIFS